MHALLRTILIITLLAAPALSLAQNATETTTHLREANVQLSHLLANDLSDEDITQIYRLSSALETSLTQLASESATPDRGKALQRLIGHVDNLRFFSEHRKREEIIEHGNRYLTNSAQLFN